jgi:hypothetical protein
MTTVRPVADLAALLLADPARVAEMNSDEARTLLAPLAALLVALAVQAAVVQPTQPLGDGASTQNGHPEGPLWLNAAQVEACYGLTAAWLKEHSRELERVPNLVCRPSRKVALYRAPTLRRWLDARVVA